MSKKKKAVSKNKPGVHFALPHAVIDHTDFIDMTWKSQALLIHMGRLYNGFNNGDLSIPNSKMKLKGWSKSTLEDAKKELLQYGWIIQTRAGARFGDCSLFAISWIDLDEVKPKLDYTNLTYPKRTLAKKNG